MSIETNRVDVSHLADFDIDGALREAADRVNEGSRRSFLTGSAVLAGGVAALAWFPGLASAATSKGDVAILNYALTLEYLESSFYAEANSAGALKGEHAKFAKTVGDHEDQHVTALQKALGSKATKKPKFDFKGTTKSQSTFAQTAIVLEDTGVKAYQGQAGNIKSKQILAAAISIHPVEARHAAWIRSIVGKKGLGGTSPAPNAFNPAADMATVLAAVKSTGFVPALGGGSAGSSSAVSGSPAVAG